MQLYFFSPVQKFLTFLQMIFSRKQMFMEELGKDDIQPRAAFCDKKEKSKKMSPPLVWHQTIQQALSVSKTAVI